MEDEPSPESVREVAAEDFLFHLYRGNELLQDDRVHEAKRELEHALALQPRDAKGQDLLAIVYFRLGLYPRAITIYERLLLSYPNVTTPRINLALCYLKTGQPGAARAQLERVIEREPGHSRAWGYLGLAFQRLGDIERAVAAFQAGGHRGMAQRLLELSGAPAEPAARGLSTPEREEVSKAASDAFEELDKRDVHFQAALSSSRGTPTSGTWAEPGLESAATFDRRSSSPDLHGMRSPLGSPNAAGGLIPSLAPSDSLPPPGLGQMRPFLPSDAPEAPAPLAPLPFASAPSAPPPLGLAPPLRLQSFARDRLLVCAREHSTSLHPSGCVLIQASADVAVRLDAVRAMSFARAAVTRPLMRKSRGKTGEDSLGGASSPVVQLDGVGEIVLGPPPGTELCPIAIGDEPLTVRESALVAMVGDITYESAKLPGGDGDFVPMVQLRGQGFPGDSSRPRCVVTLALPKSAVTLELMQDRTLLLRVHSVLGWTGRISPRAVPPSEAPTKARGLVALTGEGMVLVDGR